MRRFPSLLGLPALSFLVAGLSVAAPAPQPPAVPPDPAMLEFLADWQAADGHWVDPLTFTRIDPAKLKQRAERPGLPKQGVPASASAAPAVKSDAR